MLIVFVGLWYRYCAYIMSSAKDQFWCHVFMCEKTSGKLVLALQKACKVNHITLSASRLLFTMTHYLTTRAVWTSIIQPDSRDILQYEFALSCLQNFTRDKAMTRRTFELQCIRIEYSICLFHFFHNVSWWFSCVGSFPACA